MKIGGKAAIEVKDDGTVMAGGKPAGKFVGAELHDASDALIASVAADGTITITGAQKKVKFNDKDEVEIEGGAKIAIGDDGVVKSMDATGKPDKDSGKLKITGFKPTARRAATLLVLSMLIMKPAH
jgi:hypothetical protein